MRKFLVRTERDDLGHSSSTVAVSANASDRQRFGGLIGANEATGTITRIYATGTVTMTANHPNTIKLARIVSLL